MTKPKFKPKPKHFTASFGLRQPKHVRIGVAAKVSAIKRKAIPITLPTKA